MKNLAREDIENFFNLMQIVLEQKNLQADAELCVLISEVLEKCGLEKNDYTVKISSRKLQTNYLKN